MLAHIAWSSAAVLLAAVLSPVAAEISFTASNSGHDCTYQCAKTVTAAKGVPYVCKTDYRPTTASVLNAFGTAMISCPNKEPAKTQIYHPSRNDATDTCIGYDYQGGDSYDCKAWGAGQSRVCDCVPALQKGGTMPMGCITEARKTAHSDDLTSTSWTWTNLIVGKLCVIVECPEPGEFHHWKIDIDVFANQDYVDVYYVDVLGNSMLTSSYTGKTTAGWFSARGSRVKYQVNMAVAGATSVAIHSRCSAETLKSCNDGGMACPTGYATRPYSGDIMCGLSTTQCTVSMCCDATCGMHTCPGQRRDDAATVLCGSTPATCTNDLCCKAACDTFTCVAPYVNRATPAATVCGNTKADCTKEICCDVSCGLYACVATGFISDPAKTNIICGATIATCNDGKCCLATCVSHTCPATWATKTTPTPANIQCAGICLNSECCDVQCSQHTCTLPFLVKTANPVCGNVVQDCTDALCCDVSCSGHACPAGFVIKASPESVTCGPTAADCNIPLCCDATCDHASFTCTAPRPPRPMLSSVRCGGIAADCTDNKCCQFMCSSHACVVGLGFVDKASKATTVCGESAADCDNTKCCDVTCAHTGVTCAAPTAKAAVAAKCGALVSDCTATICCETKCTASTCPAGHVAKPTAATIVCGPTVADCTTAACCDVTCDNAGFTCPEGVLKTDPATIRCGSTVVDCTGATCCVVYCTTFTCSTGMVKVGAAATTACGSTAASCTDALCCTATCAVPTFACGVGVKKAAPATIPCGQAAADCDDGKCCEPSCTGFVCGAGFQDKASPMGMPIVCTMMMACTEAICCDATCTNTGYTTPCDANWQPKAAAATVLCGATSADCTPAKCCEPKCTLQPCLASGGLTHKAGAAALTCGITAADCNNALCCDFTCGHTSVSCGAARSLKAMPNSITCGATTGDCTTEKCCEETCGNFACSAGFTDKAAKSTIICGALSTDCSSDKCCSFNCAHTGFVCGMGALRKANAATLLCGTGATLADCTDAVCCDATCESYTCQTGFVSKAGQATIRCPTSGCDDALCCEYTCGHTSVTCPANAVKRANANLLQCGTLANCIPATCCDVTCGAYTCGTGLKAKTTPALACGPALSDCTAQKCCDVTCDNAAYACGAGTKKMGGDQLLCGAAADDCTDALCCEVSCTSYTCGSGFTSKANPAGIVCGFAVASCTDALCCDATCAHTGVACGTGKLKAASATIVCGGTVADCTVAKCCDATCQSFTCPTPGYLGKPNPDNILCGAACTNDLCCDVTCGHTLFTCVAGQGVQLRTNANGFLCGTALADCSNAKCCEVTCLPYTCPSGFVDKMDKATVVCGTDVSSCTGQLCCDTTCDVHACGTGEKKANPLGITCAATACSDMECCEPFMCDTFTCGAGFVDKTNKATTVCGGSLDDCTAVKCCDATCAGYTCTSGQLKQPTTAVCGALVSDCTDVKCCEPFVCGAFMCGAGFVDKTNKATTVCGGSASDCTEETCCDATCAGYTCTSGQLKQPTTAVCGALASDCTDVKCCEPFVCGAFMCGAGFVDKTNKATTVCGGSASDCTEETCCDVLCTSFSCSTGLLRPDASMVTCGATVAACNDATCCQAWCTSYACGVGFSDKANKAKTLCGTVVSDCTPTLCCDATCAGYTCVSGMLTQPATAVCGALVSDCTDVKCCEPFVCDTFMCGAGFVDKTNKATTVCGGSASDCTTETCCDAACAGYNCTSGQLKQPTTAVCGALASDCTDGKCCEPFVCGAFMCGAGFVDKTNKAATICGGSASDCTEETCCDVLCTSFSCSTGLLRPDASMVTCGATVAACNDATCCQAWCTSYACGVGFSDKANKAKTLCGTVVSDCTPALCCDATCKQHTCRRGKLLQPATAVCGARAADCTDVKCCDLRCKSYTCRSGFISKTGKAAIQCKITSGCDDATCCDTLCSHRQVSCKSGVLRANVDAVMCGAKPADCSFDTCCEQVCKEFECGPGTQAKNGVASIRCGGTCGVERCCDATCSHPDFSCGDGYLKESAEKILCGPTAASCKVSLCCNAATEVPDTPAPQTEIPETEAQEKVEDISTAVGGVALIGGGAAAPAATSLVVVSGSCFSTAQKRKWPFLLHPTQIEVGGSVPAGVIVGNYGIIVGASLVWKVIGVVVKICGRHWFPSFFENLDAQGFVRFPSVPLFIFLFLYQGTTLAGMTLLMLQSNMRELAGGLAAFAMSVVVPLYVFMTMKSCVPSKAVYLMDSVPRHRIFNMVVGPGEWVSVCQENHFVNRWGTMMRRYRQQTAWYAVMEFAGMFAVAAIETMNDRNMTFVQCGHVKMASALVFWAILAFEATVWPHARHRDNMLDFVSLGTQAAGLTCMAIGFYHDRDVGDFWPFTVASTLFFATMSCLMMKAILDVFTELYIFITRRRVRLQKMMFDGKISNPLLLQKRTVDPDAEMSDRIVLEDADLVPVGGVVLPHGGGSLSSRCNSREVIPAAPTSVSSYTPKLSARNSESSLTAPLAAGQADAGSERSPTPTTDVPEPLTSSPKRPKRLPPTAGHRGGTDLMMI